MTKILPLFVLFLAKRTFSLPPIHLNGTNSTQLPKYRYLSGRSYSSLPPPCPSPIFCNGRVIHTVQMAQIYNDSKTFVDMKLRHPPDEVLTQFDIFLLENGGNPTKKDLLKWVETYFDPPNSEFEEWIPADWKSSPEILERIKEEKYRQWAKDLNDLWLKLGRKMSEDTRKNPDLYSIIHVDNPVIIPGGRFREFYYWDSYWIILGLLRCEMTTTVKGMLNNFLSLIDRFGRIPNGGRVYYQRSQPPLLSGMILAYVEATNDTQFALEALPRLQREFDFFMQNHTVEVKGMRLARYGDNTRGPRPESYREDIESAEIFDSNEEKEEFWAHLRAAAESGMDFTSRFFIRNGTNEGFLTDIKTRWIIPVELNAFLCWNARIIAKFHRLSGDSIKSAEFEAKADQLREAIQTVLWHDDVGAWLDYDMQNDKRREYFSPTNLSPLWVKCFHTNDEAKITEKVLAYIDKLQLDSYPGGVPNTFEHTGEQWDYPNAWPPMQHILIKGLDNLNHTKAKNLAFKWAQRWVRSNYLAYNETQGMFEKYSALELGGHGGGGEYEVQLGFGWTNGVILDLLDYYGRDLTLKDGAFGPLANFMLNLLLPIFVAISTMLRG